MTADWPPTLLEGGICDPFCTGCLLCLLAAPFGTRILPRVNGAHANSSRHTRLPLIACAIN